jgi:hypothetical protein
MKAFFFEIVLEGQRKCPSLAKGWHLSQRTDPFPPPAFIATHENLYVMRKQNSVFVAPDDHTDLRGDFFSPTREKL